MQKPTPAKHKLKWITQTLHLKLYSNQLASNEIIYGMVTAITSILITTHSPTSLPSNTHLTPNSSHDYAAVVSKVAITEMFGTIL
jgi:hypothetical protein